MYVLETFSDLDNCGQQYGVKLFKEFDNAINVAKSDLDEHFKEWYKGKPENVAELNVESNPDEFHYSVYVSDGYMNFYRITVRPIDFEENQVQEVSANETQ